MIPRVIPSAIVPPRLIVVTPALAERLRAMGPSLSLVNGDHVVTEMVPTLTPLRKEVGDPMGMTSDVATLFFRSAPPVRREPARVAPKVGRNDPRPCGSGKKSKRCCAP
jgi:hypothetical protein